MKLITANTLGQHEVRSLTKISQQESALVKYYDKRMRKASMQVEIWRTISIVIIVALLTFGLLELSFGAPVKTYTDCHTDTECANCDLMRDIVDEWTYPNYLDDVQAYHWDEVVND
jgi:hypothetical protein